MYLERNLIKNTKYFDLQSDYLTYKLKQGIRHSIFIEVNSLFKCVLELIKHNLNLNSSVLYLFFTQFLWLYAVKMLIYT